MATVPSLQVYSPPQGLVPITDDAWRRWLTEVVWPLIGAGWNGSPPQGTFPQLQIGKAQWTNDNAFQELINVDQGIYSTYSSAVQQIIYGFACNVHRSGGNALTVGAQINAWGEAGSTGDVYGIACTALVQPFSASRNIIAIEPDIASASSTNTGQKWGNNTVFKNRGDGITAVTEGIGSNHFNYAAYAFVLTSQNRSSAGEYSGWNTGIQFLDAWGDVVLPLIWSSSATYIPGDLVVTGGLNWKCVVTNTNSSPTTVNVNWVQYGNLTEGTTFGFAGAVGIDFTPLGTVTMARMTSAIRLRNSMVFHWEETASVGSFMDSANTRLVLVGNWNTGPRTYTRQFQVDVSNGNLWVNNGIDALGAGAAATLGLISTVPGAGPNTAAQRGWYRLIDATTGNPFWVPAFQ